MGEHDHAHGPAIAAADPVDAGETADLRGEAKANAGTPVGYFLGRAAESGTGRERTYWLGRVDSARYFAARAEARARLDARARANLDADERLLATEASVELARTVGNAVVLRLVVGERPAPGGYSLIRRLAGESGTEGYGAPRSNQWVVQGLRMNVVHEFAVVSADEGSAKEVQGPWLSVPIGTVATADIQAAQVAAARREYQAREAAEAARAHEHSEAVTARRQKRAADIAAQGAAAREANERRDREHAARMAAHRKAVEELPLVEPRDVQLHLRDQGAAGMVCDVSFRRGEKPGRLWQFKVNGSVLGYPPDGRYSGRKSPDHVYRRSVPVHRGMVNEIAVYAVTDHGDARSAHKIDVPETLTYASDSGVLVFGDVGGGRFGFTARAFRLWHATEVEGRFSVAQATGLLGLWEATPGDGSGVAWAVAAHDRLTAFDIEGERVLLSRVTYMRGAGYLYRGAPGRWPSRSARLAGVGVHVELG